jgi:hypothetical protein
MRLMILIQCNNVQMRDIFCEVGGANPAGFTIILREETNPPMNHLVPMWGIIGFGHLVGLKSQLVRRAIRCETTGAGGV